MDKTVNFQIKVSATGEKDVKNITMSAEELAKSIKKVENAHEGLRTGVININQLKQSWDNAFSGMQGIVQITSELTSAYSIQEGAEVKLQTIMQQRMGATDSMVESIKTLCSAQQQIGVIGDEVQLSGAQQMATFLSEKESLDKLIPAMNDLLAQQNGLNATEQDAVSIGNMMGKAMQGQVDVLQRVGISFSDAQKHVLQYGTEEERAAILSEVIRQNVGEMNKRLAETDSGRMKQFSNTIGDIKEQIGSLLMPIDGIIIKSNEFLTAFNNIIGVGIGIKGLAGTVKTLSVAHIASAANTKVEALAKQLLNKANITAAASTNALRIATIGLYAVASGLLVGAIYLAINIFKRYSESAEKTVSSQKKIREASEEAAQAMKSGEERLRQVRSEMELNISRLKSFKGTKDQEKKIVEEMNQKYGSSIGYYRNVSQWYNALIGNSEAYCRQMINETRLRALANQAALLEQSRHEILYDDKGNRKKYSKAKKKTAVASEELVDAGDGIFVPKSYSWKEEASDLEKATASYKALGKQIEHVRNQMEKIAKENSNIEIKKFEGYSASGITDSNTSSSTSTAKTKDENLVLRENADTYADLANNLRYYENQLEHTSKTDTEAIGKISEKIRATKSEMEAIKKLINVQEEANDVQEDGIELEIETNTQKLQKALDDARKEFENAVTVDAKVKAQAKIDEIQREIDRETKGELTIEATVEPTYITKGSIDDLRRSYENAQSRASRIQMDLEIGLIGKKEAEEQIADLNRQLKGMGKNLKPLKIEVDTKNFDRAMKSMKKGWNSIKGISDGVNGITEALKGNGSAWEKTCAIIDGMFTIYEGITGVIELINLLTTASLFHKSAKAAESVATGIATGATIFDASQAPAAAAEKIPLIAANKAAAASYLEMASAAYFAAHAYIPFAGFGIATGFATGAASITKTIGAMAFADGGVVYGPTLGLIGEYAGARSNPEVIAPLDKLRSLIHTDGNAMEGRVEFKIRGRRLEGVLEKERRHRIRS